MRSGKASQWVRPEIQAMSAYSVGSYEGMIKLDAMENPYVLSADLRQQWLERLRDIALNRYPEPRPQNLQKAMADFMSAPTQLSVLLGNGSDELIQLMLMAVARPGATILTPEPGFSMYALLAQALGLNYIGVPLQANDFSLALPEMLAAIEQHQPAIIFLAYPNNPTGNLFAKEDVEKILDQAPGLVVIDEAYSAFASDSWLPRVPDYPNMVLLRTLSKTGLAGIRLGVLFGHAEWVGELNKIRLPYNINALTQATTQFALSQPEIWREQAALICSGRATLIEKLTALAGLQVFVSEANFVLFRCPAGTGEKVFSGLCQQGILIKSLAQGHSLLHDCLRVTVGTEDENTRFIVALKEVLAQL